MKPGWALQPFAGMQLLGLPPDVPFALRDLAGRLTLLFFNGLRQQGLQPTVVSYFAGICPGGKYAMPGGPSGSSIDVAAGTQAQVITFTAGIGAGWLTCSPR